MSTSILSVEKRTDSKFDILKLVMAVFVVALHTDLFPYVLYPWLRIAVPMFFIMTGYFFFKKINKFSEYNTQVSIVKGFVVRNVKLYAFWFLFQLPMILYIRKDLYFGHGLLKGLWAFVKSILFGSTFTASWYIVASIYGVLIIFFGLRKVPNGVLLVISGVIYILLSLFLSYKVIVFEIPFMKSIYDVWCSFFGNPATSFLSAVVWISCGKCFADGTFRNKKTFYAVISVVTGVALYAEWRFVIMLGGSYKNDCYFILLPFCIGLFGYLNSLGEVSISHSVNMRRCSTILFALHGVVGRLNAIFFREILNTKSTLLRFLSTITICACVYLFIEMIICKYPNKRISRILKNAY